MNLSPLEKGQLCLHCLDWNGGPGPYCDDCENTEPDDSDLETLKRRVRSRLDLDELGKIAAEFKLDMSTEAAWRVLESMTQWSVSS